jgi:hypothetical protein
MNSLSRAINIPSSLLFSRIVRMKEKKGKEKVELWTLPNFGVSIYSALEIFIIVIGM